MSRLHLVRHGQAMFLTDDYDRLSPLGGTQAERTGRALADEIGGAPEFLVGTLKRQQQTLAALRATGGFAEPRAPGDPTFDEFPFDAMLRQQVARWQGRNAAVDAAIEANEAAESRHDRIRAVQQLLELSIAEWIAADRSDGDAGIPAWSAFCDRVVGGIARIQEITPSGSDVVIVTSGGVVAAIVQHALNVAPEVASRLCWRVNNASITQLTFDRKRLSLDHFNRVGHLPTAERTYR